MPVHQVLVDSDFFIATMVDDDGSHERSLILLDQIKQRQATLVSTNFVVAETATTLSYKFGQATASEFLRFAKAVLSIHITEETQEQTTKLFLSQTKRGTSMVDCSNVVVARNYDIHSILSFDKFYKRNGLKYFGD